MPLPVHQAEDYHYRVQPRDILSVIVWEHPELSIPTGEFRSAEESGRLVREDGTIFYPYAGIVQVGGLTVEQIRRLLVERLEPLIQNPQVDVRVAAFRSQRAYVTGQVRQPGVLPITDVPLSVLDAINGAGGLDEEANRARAYLLRDGRTHPVDLNALYDEGDIGENYLLRHGDVLNVPDNFDNKVFVLGEVGVQSPVYLHRGKLSLAEAITHAEGIDLDRADTAGVYVIRGETNAQGELQPKAYQLDARSPVALVLADAFPLQARDVVFVSTAPLSRWNRVVSQILPTVQAIWQTRQLTR